MANKIFFSILFILSLSAFCSGRLITNRTSDLISDGLNHDFRFQQVLRLNPFSASEACEQTYGLMPCTTSAFGNLFLILVYGYLMFLAATYLSGGSELLLEILGPGIVGGLFLPVLGALPDALLILVSGLSGSVETAQSQVSVGMGLLAGSTVMLITVIWGTCVVVGKCDLENYVAIDGKDTKRFSLTGSGVSNDIWTSYAAMIMAVSVIPFIVVQFPQLLHSTSGRHLAVLIALIISVLLLISYCLYQDPVTGFFRAIDENNDGYLSASELRALILGISFDEINLNEDAAVDKVMKDFDKSCDARVDLSEFINGIGEWLKDAARTSKVSSLEAGPETMKYLTHYHEQTKREHDLLGDHSDESEGVENPKWTTIKAALLLLLGTVIAALVANPLVDAVDNFSSATSIPSFFISFIALPLATNSSEAVSAIIFASRKKLRTASLTFSELYGAVTMNNTLCLSVFLALVYSRGLVWDFSSEVLVILIVCFVMGVLGSIRTTFPLWTASLAFLLYPLSLALVYVLDYVFGWS